jgi:hypothetical protein
VVAQNRVVTLDVSRVRGDQLQIQIRPPSGYWALNSFAVDYSTAPEPRVQRIPAVTAEDESGKSVIAAISGIDESYYEMPVIGNRAYITFPAPKASKPGSNRTSFLHARGYYRVHLPAEGEPNREILQQTAQVPDLAARLAAMRFSQWRSTR